MTAELDKVVLALTCLFTASDYQNTPINLDSRLMYETLNTDTTPANCAPQIMNHLPNMIESLKQESRQQEELVERLEKEIVELEKLITSTEEVTSTSLCDAKANEIAEISTSAGKIKVVCKSNRYGDNWMQVMNRESGANFRDKKRNDLITGFGDLQGDFFLGFEKLHAITETQPHQVLVLMIDQDDVEEYLYSPLVSIGTAEEEFKLKASSHNSNQIAATEEVRRRLFGGNLIIRIFIKPPELAE